MTRAVQRAQRAAMPRRPGPRVLLPDDLELRNLHTFAPSQVALGFASRCLEDSTLTFPPMERRPSGLFCSIAGPIIHHNDLTSWQALVKQARKRLLDQVNAIESGNYYGNLQVH